MFLMKYTVLNAKNAKNAKNVLGEDNHAKMVKMTTMGKVKSYSYNIPS